MVENCLAHLLAHIISDIFFDNWSECKTCHKSLTAYRSPDTKSRKLLVHYSFIVLQKVIKHILSFCLIHKAYANNVSHFNFSTMTASSLLNSITVWILFWVYFNDRERVTGKFTANAENLKQENRVVALNSVSRR